MNRIGSCSDFILTCFQACGCSEEESSNLPVENPPAQTESAQTAQEEDSPRQSISLAMLAIPNQHPDSPSRSQPFVADAIVIKV